MLLLLACATPVEFTVTPETLDLGTVDFVAEMPEDGFAQGVVTLTNGGEEAVSLTMPEYDTESLCLLGFTTQELPVEMGVVNPGSSYQITVGICGYPPGSDGSLVGTSFDVWTDGDPDTLTVPVSFTPNRISE
jgi:hypothetical protein